MGLKLTGQNENIANNAVKSKSIMGSIKNALEHPQKREEFIEDLTNKGMVDVSNKLLHKTDSLIVNSLHRRVLDEHCQLLALIKHRKIQVSLFHSNGYD